MHSDDRSRAKHCPHICATQLVHLIVPGRLLQQAQATADRAFALRTLRRTVAMLNVRLTSTLEHAFDVNSSQVSIFCGIVDIMVTESLAHISCKISRPVVAFSQKLTTLMHITHFSTMDSNMQTTVVDRLRAKVSGLKAKVSSLEARLLRVESSLSSQLAQITRLQIANVSSCDGDSSSGNVEDDAPVPRVSLARPDACMRQIDNSAQHEQHALLSQTFAERTSMLNIRRLHTMNTAVRVELERFHSNAAEIQTAANRAVREGTEAMMNGTFQVPPPICAILPAPVNPVMLEYVDSDEDAAIFNEVMAPST